MFKLIQFSKKHWKKLTFGCVPVIYGLNVFQTNNEITKYMRKVCKEFESDPNGNIRNVLVVLNPVANSKKSEKMFSKYCEPFLHLAGFYVEIVKTSQVGHAKNLIESLESLPDVIIIAGGDGTASEVVTGLFRRNDTPCPILVLPLGKTNKTSLKNFNVIPESKLEYVQCLHNSIKALVENRQEAKNVFKYDLLKDDGHTTHKPVYGLRQFSWGLINEIEANKNKYWFFGPLRHYAAALFQGVVSNTLNKSVYANAVYTPPCQGCANCIIPTTTGSPSSASKLSFSNIYVSKAAPTKTMQRINKECEMENIEKFNVNQIDIISSKNADLFDEMNLIEIKVPIPDQSLFDNIESIVTHKVNPYKTINCRTVKILPWEKSETESNSYNSYYIDGEEYDIRPIKISLLPNAIQMFC